jgi:hypothetical protein
MDLVDKARHPAAHARRPGADGPVSPYLQRPLRSLEEALAELEASETCEAAWDFAWDRTARHRD